jgi:tetratricopeptide (TPR) repeat protein
MMLGYIFLARGDLDAACPVLERACGIARETNVTVHRAHATRLLGGAYLLAGRIDEGAALVRAAAAEIESRRLLVQEAAVLVSLAEACFRCDRLDEASTAAQRALTVAQERGQRGDAAAALHVLGEAAARGAVDLARAAHHYQAAIALAGALEMRPLLARSHLGIGRLRVRVGDRERAKDHLVTAMRLFSALNMPLWLPQAASSLSELNITSA